MSEGGRKEGEPRNKITSPTRTRTGCAAHEGEGQQVMYVSIICLFLPIDTCFCRLYPFKKIYISVFLWDPPPIPRLRYIHYTPLFFIILYHFSLFMHVFVIPILLKNYILLFLWNPPPSTSSPPFTIRLFFHEFAIAFVTSPLI